MTERATSGGARARDGRDEADTAIVGMACRLPGAADPDAFWRLLRSGASAVRRFSREQLADAGVTARRLEASGFVPVDAALDDVESFEPQAFGMSAREAALTAPQQRLLLEVARELLIVSGYEVADDLRIGVFAGAGHHLASLSSHLLNQVLGMVDVDDPVEALQAVIGNEADFAATRIAYRLDLRGPAVSVQTACSTSLVALHVARQALRNGDCDAAIVAAGAVHVPHPSGYVYRRGSILSPSGTCRAFDADADGTVIGNGVAAVLLRPLAAARADGDAIRAIVRGSAVNNDGATKSAYAAPSEEGQVVALRSALAGAGVDADAVGYVQAHGTGTAKGDPIEVRALARAFGSAVVRGSCVLGSVKPNVGHLDTCAGLAGLLAAVLALEHGEAPPQINFERPNPVLELDATPFRVVGEPTPLSRSHALVSALGVGGTNAHVVVEAA